MCAYVFPYAPNPSAAVQQDVKPLWRIDSRDVPSSSRDVAFPMSTADHPMACETACAQSVDLLEIVQPGWRLGGASSRVPPFLGLIKCAPICGIIHALRKSCADDPQPGQPDAHRLFTTQPTKEKRSLLNLLLSNSTPVRGKLATTQLSFLSPVRS